MNDYIEPLFNMHKIKFEKLDEIAEYDISRSYKYLY